MDSTWIALIVSISATAIVAAVPNIVLLLTRRAELKHEREDHYFRRKIEVLEKFTEQIFCSNYKPLGTDFYHVCGVVHMYIPAECWDTLDEIVSLASNGSTEDARALLGVLLKQLDMPESKLMKFKRHRKS